MRGEAVVRLSDYKHPLYRPAGLVRELLKLREELREADRRWVGNVAPEVYLHSMVYDAAFNPAENPDAARFMDRTVLLVEEVDSFLRTRVPDSLGTDLWMDAFRKYVGCYRNSYVPVQGAHNEFMSKYWHFLGCRHWLEFMYRAIDESTFRISKMDQEQQQ